MLTDVPHVGNLSCRSLSPVFFAVSLIAAQVLTLFLLGQQSYGHPSMHFMMHASPVLLYTLLCTHCCSCFYHDDKHASTASHAPQKTLFADGCLALPQGFVDPEDWTFLLTGGPGGFWSHPQPCNRLAARAGLEGAGRLAHMPGFKVCIKLHIPWVIPLGQ